MIINLPTTAANKSLVTTTSYNAAGDATSVSETPTGQPASGVRTTAYAYDKLGRVTQWLLPIPGLDLPVTAQQARRIDLHADRGFRVLDCE